MLSSEVTPTFPALSQFAARVMPPRKGAEVPLILSAMSPTLLPGRVKPNGAGEVAATTHDGLNRPVDTFVTTGMAASTGGGITDTEMGSAAVSRPSSSMALAIRV